MDTKTLLKKPGKPCLPPKSFLCGPHFLRQRKVPHWSTAVCAFFPCPSSPWPFRKHQGNPENTKDFSYHANPRKPCKTSRKHSKRPRKFPGRKTPRKQKHQGKEGHGLAPEKPSEPKTGTVRTAPYPEGRRIEKIQSREAILKKSSFQCGMKISIENGYFIAKPSGRRRTSPGIEIFELE